MAESKKETEQSGKKPKSLTKTTTGAWWKSKVQRNKDEQAAAPEVGVPATSVKALETGKKEAVDQSVAGIEPQKGGLASGKVGKKPSSGSGRKKTSAPKTEVPLKAEDEKKSVARNASPEKSSPPQSEKNAGPESASPAPITDKETTEVADNETRQGGRSRGRRGAKKKSVQRSGRERQAGSEHLEQPTAADNGGRQGGGKHTKDTDQKLDAGVEKPVGTQHRAEEKQLPVVKLLINADEPEECRLALLEDGRLESLHVTTVGRVHTRNNIYKAKVVAIESNLQAAFIDYGVEKNGFLAFNEIHPEYYKQGLSAEIRKLVDNQQWKRLSISDVIERGQELLVQVVKEEIGRKGANMTTYLSLPGRNVVLMPGSDSEGISRKISGEERRNQLREIMNSLKIPEGIGWIVRTASVEVTKTALSRDVRFLLKLWREIKEKGRHMEGVGLLYQDHNCVMRFLREQFDPAIQEILVDDETALEKVREFTMMLPAKQRKVRVKLHRGARPIFNHYSVEDQIESIYQPNVSLPSGGSIVIEPTEALVSIDVNSGSTGKGKNFEETIFQANMEAATELARQLRLRDLGGLIVIDFIDMRSSKNVREVEKQVKTAMKRDKAKVDISRISRFGLMQISRQKLGSPIESGNYRLCENCRGRGTVKSAETLALFYLRRIHTGASRKQVVDIQCRFPLDVTQYLLNNKRQEIMDLEEKYQTKVLITADPTLKPMEHEISFGKTEKEESGKKQP